MVVFSPSPCGQVFGGEGSGGDAALSALLSPFGSSFLAVMAAVGANIVIAFADCSKHGCWLEALVAGITAPAIAAFWEWSATASAMAFLLAIRVSASAVNDGQRFALAAVAG